MKFSKVAKYTIALWAVIVPFYGWFFVTETMKHLESNPSPDTYANNLEFQIAAFAFTQGLASVFLLGIVLLVEFSFLVKGEPKKNSSSNNDLNNHQAE